MSDPVAWRPFFAWLLLVALGSLAATAASTSAGGVMEAARADVTEGAPPDCPPEQGCLLSVRDDEITLSFVSRTFYDAHHAELGLTPIAESQEDRAPVVHAIVRLRDAPTREALVDGRFEDLRIGAVRGRPADLTLRQMRTALGGLDGAEVVALEDPETAVRQLADWTWDVVLLDAASWSLVVQHGLDAGLASVRTGAFPPLAVAWQPGNPDGAGNAARTRATARRLLADFLGTSEGRQFTQHLGADRFVRASSPRR